MTDWLHQPINDNGFWQKCAAHDVKPSDSIASPPNSYLVVHVHSRHGIRGSVKLTDASFGIAPETSRFVLISDQLPSETIQRLTTVLRNNRLSSGYLVREALDYQTIYLIDPNQDFTASDRTLFVDNDRTLIKINGNTGSELAQDLASKLS